MPTQRALCPPPLVVSNLHSVQVEDVEVFQRIRYTYLRHVKVHTWERVAETRVAWNASTVAERGEAGR